MSLVAYKGIVFAVNCGSSEAICMTRNGRVVKLAKSHTTKNEEEVSRIVKQGGQLYQTIVNFPYRKEMKIAGPLRVFPDGLTVTRTLGKTMTSSRQHRVRTVSDTVGSISKGVISEP